MAMLKEYFQIYTEKTIEYGKNTAVLIQNGAFFECYQRDEHYIDSEKIGNADIIAKVLNNMKYTGKYFGKSTYINFMGFTSSSLDKYLTLLLNANYTVIIVSELQSSNEKKEKGNLQRGITKIYSPSLQPIENDSQNLMCILFYITDIKSSNKKNAVIQNSINTSICCINNSYNTIELSENLFKVNLNDKNALNNALEELERVIYRYFPKEFQINIKCETIDFFGIETIENFFNNNYENVIIHNFDYKKYKCISDQNLFLKNIYSHIDFGITTPIEYMNLQEFNLSIINLIYTIEFISKHDSTYTKNLVLPKMILENTNLILELNTITQLNIISKTVNESVFDIINFTKTTIGKRHLTYLLCKPFKCPKIIEERYNITDSLEKVNLDTFLSDITDFEKLHRKMSLQLLHPYEFEKLHYNYLCILKIINELKETTIILPDTLHLIQYISEYTIIFNLEKLKGIELTTNKDDITNYFNINIIPELDIIQDDINKLEIKREDLRMFYNEKIATKKDLEMIKLIYTDEEYLFTCTKIRFKLLQSKMTSLNENLNEKMCNNSAKFCPKTLKNLSDKIISSRTLLQKKIKLFYIKYIDEFYSKYSNLFKILKEFIEVIDVCYSNLKCKKKYNYNRPQLILDKNNSFLEVIQLRHPIIERLGTNYIPNDITLNEESCGMLLYALNSAGKSSLLRAIGISIILAQCGLFVPCKSLRYFPFNTIISQVDLTDNLFSGKSSFITEMMGLKTILHCSGKNTLCLADEVLKGTETNSAMGLIVAMISKLTNNNTKFFFTSHLHQIPKIEEIQELSKTKLQIKHLGVSTKNNNIIYNRKLQDGSGSQLYGIEVAKNIIQDQQFIDTAFKIRNNLINEKKIKIDTKKSIYNRKKVVDFCEICKSTKSLETDHIIEQQTADNNGFVPDGYHKNELFNLASLCKVCHLKKTQGKIIIHGYVDSINGRFLDYTIIQ